MPSLEDFQTLVETNPEKAFTDYVLAIDEVSFDWKDAAAGVRADAGIRHIEWRFEEPNTIKMYPSQNVANSEGKQIYYLPWKSKEVTKVTLDQNSPPYFLTSEFSNCRFTIQFHDACGKTVTVMHIAGDVAGGGSISGGNKRNEMEISSGLVPNLRTRRLSISKGKPGSKGPAWKRYTESAANTVYYDSQAVVFGFREKNGCWSFYAQNIDNIKNGKGLINLSS